MYAVYILLCADNSYYTGISNDLEKRIWQHETGFFPECYTFKRRPVKLVWHRIVDTAVEANNLEKQIKGWSRKKKEALINNDIAELRNLSNQKKGHSQVLRQAQGKTEVLIIGQGISGTCLSYHLSKANISFLVIDDGKLNAPSRVAAGIINPVTGRRIVRTWMIEELLPFIWNFYNELGTGLDIKAISEKTIIDFFPSPQMKLAFEERMNEGESYLQKPINENSFREQFNYDFGYGMVSTGYTVHLENILPAWRHRLVQQQKLIEEEFDISHLSTKENSLQYKDIEAQKIIFCDGVQSAQNQFFNKLPFAPNKGEMLIVEIPGLSKDYLYKKGMTLSPLESNDLFWLGSNYLWEFKDELPSAQFYKQAEQLLNSWLKLPFKILEHKVSIRPATIERRPFVGFHPQYNSIGILNGMGTKGTSLAPFFANQLVQSLLFDAPITKEADVKRFARILSR